MAVNPPYANVPNNPGIYKSTVCLVFLLELRRWPPTEGHKGSRSRLQPARAPILILGELADVEPRTNQTKHMDGETGKSSTCRQKSTMNTGQKSTQGPHSGETSTLKGEVEGSAGGRESRL